jgi:hypothetical protein
VIARLRDWLFAGLVLCPQCGCLADRRHGSASCGRFLRDTVQELQREELELRRRVRALQETQREQAKLLEELSALTADPFD